MPLEPVDLTSLDAYSEKCKREVARITKDGMPFWLYKDFSIDSRGTPVKTILVVLQNRSKISSLLLKAKLVSSGTCALEDGKIGFSPEHGKVPYGLLKKQEARFFGTKKILIPSGADLSEEEGGADRAAINETPVPGASGVNTPPQTASNEQGSGQATAPALEPKPATQTQPSVSAQPKASVQQPTATQQHPPQQPGDSPARAKFMADLQAANEVLMQARAVVPDSVAGGTKATLLQLPKVVAAMNDASSKRDWAKATEALKMAVEGATHVVEEKKQVAAAKAAFQKDFTPLKLTFEGAKGLPAGELSSALQTQQGELIRAWNSMAASAASMDWVPALKVLTEVTPKLKKFGVDKSAQDTAKKKFGVEYEGLKGEFEAVRTAKAEGFDAPLQQQHAHLVQGMKDIGGRTAAKEWSAAYDLLVKLAPEFPQFSAAEQKNQDRVSFEKEYAKVQSQLQAALAIPPAELAANLQPIQQELQKAADAVTAQITKTDWLMAEMGIDDVKDPLKDLLEGKRDQDLARRDYLNAHAKLWAKVEWVQQQEPSPPTPVDGLRQACLDAYDAMAAQATALEYADASLALADVVAKTDAYVKAHADAEVARATKVGNAKAAALADTADDVAGAKALPADTAATHAVRNAATATDALAKSKELQDMINDATKIDDAWKKAVLLGVPGPMAAVTIDINGCLEKCRKYQAEYEGAAAGNDKAKFDVADMLRSHLEAVKQGLDGLAPAMKYVGSVENAGEEGAAKAAAVLVKLLKNAQSPEAKKMLVARYDEIAARLSKPGDNLDRQREIARVLGGDKEKAFFDAQYALLLPNIQAADSITTVTKETEKARAEYKKAKSIVDSAAARGDYAVAMSALPKLAQAGPFLLDINNRVWEEADERSDRRNKANEAYKKAASKDEIEEIAKSMGGEVQAAFKRQAAAGPMKQQTDAALSMAAAQVECALQNAAESRNCEAARLLAERLINDSGEIETVGLFLDDPDQVAGGLGAAPHSKQLARTLKKLRDEPQLQQKLCSIGKPEPANPACQLIRSSLGLATGDEVTEVHARKAVLSAMLAELRQKDVGSCFATSTAIRVHDDDPGRLLDDLKQMIERGKLTRNIPQLNAPDFPCEVPINMQVSEAALAVKVKLEIDGNMPVPGDPNAPQLLIWDTPPVAAALKAFGIPPEKRQEVMDIALGVLQTSKVQAGLAAIGSALPAEIPNPADTTKNIPNKIREDLLAKIPALLAEHTEESGAKAALEAELTGLPDSEKEAVLSSFDEYFDPAKAEYDFTTEDIVKQAAMTEAGISEADLAARDRLNEMSLKIRSVRGDAPKSDDKLLNEYSELAGKLNAQREQFGKYDVLVGAAKNAYLAQQDNRLLRAWEYSVSSMGEEGVGQMYAPAIQKATGDQVGKILADTATNLGGSGPTPAKLTQAATALTTKFGELWVDNVKMGYDANTQGKLSADGSSNRGAFRLFDKAGINDPNQHIGVKDKQSYNKLIEGLITKAKAELLATEADTEVAGYIEKLGVAVAEKTEKAPDSLVKGAVDALQADGKIGYKEPWQVVDGNEIAGLLSSYYGQELNAMNASIQHTQATDPEEATGWLLTSGRQLMANIADKTKLTPETRIPMFGGNHIWNLRPGDPTVRKVLESPDDAAAFKDAERAKYEAQKATPLTEEMTWTLIEDTVGKDWAPSLVDDLKAVIPPDSKAEDVVTKVKAYFDTNEPEFADAAELRAAMSVMKNVIPPVEVAGGKLSAHLDATLKKLKLGDKEAEVKAAVIANLNIPGKPVPTSVSMSTIEKTTAKILKLKDLRPDENAAAAEVYNAQKPPAEPLGLPFGDSNWGGGDHHVLFTMMRNPINGKLEMWKCNEDGSSPTKMDEASWINGKTWSLATDPALVGGLV